LNLTRRDKAEIGESDFMKIKRELEEIKGEKASAKKKRKIKQERRDALYKKKPKKRERHKS